MRTVTVGTRGSTLALAQTRWVVARLKEEWPETDFRIQTISTKGDRNRESLEQLAQKGDKGFWVKEIEEALLAKKIDIAVHSLKDLPTEQPEGLEISSIPKRVDGRDALIGREGMKKLAELPEGARIGTSSVRRKAFLRAYRPDLIVKDLRGNIDTRLAALGSGEYDAIILAAAGLIRTEQRHRIDEFVDPDILLPAPGQGALALETRTEDDLTIEVAYAIHDHATDDRITAEREFLAGLGAGCMAPVGAHAVIKNGLLTLEGWVGALDGTQVIRATSQGDVAECADIGAELAADMLERGAAELIEAVRE
ncbi:MULTISPECIES: hydroxymethylbilane synthase [Deinococcus]|jgi:hydroxymethylbilane synthase (EC 2.5.1.61)|uniref:Porphobilinogen deaminase n=1 Tax=Deinococcus radiodurans (strain ATCC 13939 / DSM 20539 / JCM 16871 / CCUG 27074 / LMG 4051 / NBRC 15346 / NCIMB 9279 / VKM B-1422 / R1) TaxID=243230 RepID=HEM3_DEIRA|nr:hydroxymethylbilane synthase [Deinococcus radiodurans]Q9RRY0.1 RecName: Full=Porphobilinogen deaminase; Short=PBG; AltName: Full=Hydroxymethylbilane synthase; Short=HMBS; AltName: Full=Pre-uroporphyrinogen synthase [Deinococcus radiodurans R1 = ATCC 13939 = DSM 20539]AAF11898.1 porphobilinogen deaminase [Deinococcus radiodurans R1 = ATCC 13939 = DSM 20539]ANC70600.1 hydroxymethylbilane synthase [Deinococcus radiodurans R1 = ATCC 13939 = DSM 20539]QEM71728.1 hydroxymethylbilane synthase [Dein